MTIPIVLYDENHERVGETYHRRAKQLVRSGRAVWLVEGQSLLLAPAQEDQAPPPLPKEEPKMTESISNNGITPEAHSPGSENPLLMYLAKQNVAQKRNLIKNIVAYVLVWMVLITMSVNFISTTSIRSRRASNPFAASSTIGIQSGMDYIVFDLPEMRPFRWRPGGSDLRAYVFEHVYDSISSSINSNFEFITVDAFAAPQPLHVTTGGNSLWHFIVGIMFAWGVWIAARGITIARRHAGSRPGSPRPDPVEMEYQRLSARA